LRIVRETRAYLDHASTAPMRPEAVAAMLPFITDRFGNPSGSHAVSRQARRALDDARDSVARDLGCDPGEVVFTSGGTEADNLAVLGARSRRSGVGQVAEELVCTAVEHHAVLRPCEALGATKVAVDPVGVVHLAALADVLHPGVRLVSVMLANNEIGTVEPIAEVAGLVRERAPQAVLHTDAVAAVGWLDVAGSVAEADLVSISAHKFGGPKGVGALVARDTAVLAPVLRGGAQERGRRPGTEDVAGIVAMAAALSVATANADEDAARIGRLRDRLADGILATVDEVAESATDTSPTAPGLRHRKLASSLHLRFGGLDSEDLLLLLDDAGICASAGAACASGALEPSHVLAATGVPPSAARSAVRFSLGPTTTSEEIEYTLEVLPKAVAQLRSS
jgi:cysteine desulfurase